MIVITRSIVLACLVLMLAAPIQTAASAWEKADTWIKVKNIVADKIYPVIGNTFYCGCLYESHEDDDGSATILDFNECYQWRGKGYVNAACALNWEHVVPAALTPAAKLPCWAERTKFEDCGNLSGRDCCEEIDVEARKILFDPHNLVPAVGQINQLRRDDRYAELEQDSAFGNCTIKDGRGFFEPPDCKKGDVARIWLYMRDAHGVQIEDSDLRMFGKWSEKDPVSPWEAKRERRIFNLTGMRNDHVSGEKPDQSGACPWELSSKSKLRDPPTSSQPRVYRETSGTARHSPANKG